MIWAFWRMAMKRLPAICARAMEPKMKKLIRNQAFLYYL
jgi:hypothetical protein